MASMKLDPEFQEAIAPYADMVLPTYTDPISFRAGNDAALAAAFNSLPQPEGLVISAHTATSQDGATIEIRRYVPRSAGSIPGPQRAAVFVFGGGMISGNLDLFSPYVGILAQQSNTQIFAVGYRIAPEHPFPKGVEDTYSAIQWLQANAGEFNVDPARIVIAGPSAGGGIAAGTALMARDKGLNPPLAGQVLRYPMLDDRTTLEADSPLGKHVSWTTASNDMGWKAYLGGKDRHERNDENVSPYAAPARAKDLSGLPATYIDTGGLDLFRDEDIAYAARLAAANIYVEFHLYPGVTHGFEIAAPNIRVVKEANANFARFLSSF
jgi:acetyl esterase/lipase